MRKLLMVSYHFPPSAASGSFRLLGFARHLPSQGWRVGVVAPPTLPWEAVDPRLAEQVPPETARFDAPYPESLLAKKLFDIWSWLPRALATARHAIHTFRPDAVLTSSPYHGVHLVGLALKRRHALPWVADFRDPWYTARTPQDRPGPMASRLERMVLNRADAIVWNTPAVCEAVQSAFPDRADRMVSITNGFDPEQFGPRTRDRHPGDPIDLLHAGVVYNSRDPRPLLDALATIDRDGAPLAGKFRAAFIGPGAEAGATIVAEAHARGLGDRVTVEGHQPYARALQRMVDADLSLLLDAPGRRLGVPAKLYEYLGAGAPVLALGERDGDLAWVLRRSGVPHRIAPPGDAAEIGRALIELADDLESGRGPAPGASQVLQFTREGVARQLADVLDRCAGADRPEPLGPVGAGDRHDRWASP